MELSKVTVTLFADTKEYMEKMTKADEKMAKFGLTAETSSSKMTAFANKASSAMIGFGVGAIAYGVDAAYKFQEALDKVKNQSNLTDTQLEKLRGHIIDTSNQTGISAEALANASLIMSQAGITGTKSFQLMNAAAKAAVITNTDVASVTQTLISAQTLQVAKGMSVVDLTGKLVAGSKSFVGGLQAEEAMLKGRVGVALASYGLKLSQIIPIGAEFTKVAMPARSVASFAQALGNIQNPTKAYAKGLANVGLSAAQLGRDVRSGNVIQLLKDVNEAAIKGGGPLSQYTNAVFGKTGGAGASVLIKNLQDLVKVQNQVSGGGANSLAKSFADASKQLGPQLKIFDANLTNALISVGQVVLPKLSGLLSGLNSFFKNKGAVDAVGISLAAAFVASMALKVKKVFNAGSDIWSGLKSVYQKFTLKGSGGSPLTGPQTAAQGTTMIDLLKNIDINTAKMAGGKSFVSKTERTVTKYGGSLLPLIGKFFGKGGGTLLEGASMGGAIAGSDYLQSQWAKDNKSANITASNASMLLKHGFTQAQVSNLIATLKKRPGSVASWNDQTASGGGNSLDIMRQVSKNSVRDFMTYAGWKPNQGIVSYDKGKLHVTATIK